MKKIPIKIIILCFILILLGFILFKKDTYIGTSNVYTNTNILGIQPMTRTRSLINPDGVNYISETGQLRKYTNDPLDPECATNWNYYAKDGTTLILGNIPNITMEGDNKNWCATKPAVTGDVCSSSTALNGQYYYGNDKKCDYLLCNNGYNLNLDEISCSFSPGIPCEGTDPNGYYTYDVNSICKLISCNINYAIDGSSCTVKQNTYGNSCGDNKFIDINGNCPNLLKAVTSTMYVANYLYGKQSVKGLLYTSSTPKGPWTSQSTTPDFVVRVSRTPTGFMGTGGDSNIYVSPVIAESGPWTKHPTLLATKNYYQVLSLINGGIAGLNTTLGQNGGYNMTLDGKVIEANKSSFSRQVFQLSDGTVGRIDAGFKAHINVGHTSFADSWSTAIYPSTYQYNWILPMQDGSVYVVNYEDNNLYYSKTGFRPPSGGAIGTGVPVWEQLDTTMDYQCLF